MQQLDRGSARGNASKAYRYVEYRIDPVRGQLSMNDLRRHGQRGSASSSGMPSIVIVPADRSTPEGNPINLGDALLADALAEEVERRGHRACVVDFGEGSRVDTRGRVHVERFGQLFRLVRRADLVIVGGGTLLQHESRGVLRAGLPRFVAVVSALSALAGTRLVLFGVGCDPIENRVSRLLYKLAIGGRRVWLRDSESAQRAREYFGLPGDVAADVSLFLPSESRPSSERNGVVVALNRREAGTLTAADMHELRGDGPVRFLDMHQRDSDRDSEAVELGVLRTEERIEHQIPWTVAKAEVSRASRVVASRMHALYLALITDTPMIAVGSSAKVAAFAAEFEVPIVPTVSLAPAVEAVRANPDRIADARARLSQALSEAFSA